MKIPYLTDSITRTMSKRFHNSNRGIAIVKFGIILFELPMTPVTLRWVRIQAAH